jgi:hypothetical protein
MKYLNFILTLIAFCLIILSAAIYFKPVANRYIFKDVEDNRAQFGYRIFDTATGKVYNNWRFAGMGPSGEEVRGENVNIEDNVSNRLIKRSVNK